MARGRKRSAPRSPQPPPSTHQLGTRQSSRIVSRRVTDTAASDPGSPSHQDVPEDEEESAAETPTRVGSQESAFTLPDIPSPAAVAETAAANPLPQQERQTNKILPLIERVPSVETIVEFLKGSHRVKAILANPTLFQTDEDMTSFLDAYFAHCKGEEIPEPDSDEWFWEDVRDYMFESMCENIPTCRRDLKKCRRAYFQDGVHLVAHFRTRLLEEYSCKTPEYQRRLRNVSGLIGGVFVELFEQLTAPPCGTKIELISQQLQRCIEHIATTPLDKLLEEGIDKRIYYIAGFLCRAAEKEAARRTQDPDSPGFDVGQSIIEAASHFVSERSPSEVAEVKESLPAGVASLVDKWSVFGGLKYPTRQFYSLIAKIEYCYVQLATAENLRTYGGIVVSYICNEIATNDALLGHFGSLLKEERYDESTIQSAFKYYIKVFGNLRVKDLSRKLNAQLHKSTTAALRPSLATKGTKKSKRSKAKSKSKVKKKPKAKAKEADISEEELHNELLDIANNSADDDSDYEE